MEGGIWTMNPELQRLRALTAVIMTAETILDGGIPDLGPPLR
jgi:hypothetical protein